MVGEICYRSPCHGHNTAVRQKCSSPLVVPPMPACWPIRLLRPSLYNADPAVGPWQWGLELLEAKRIPHRSIGLTRSVLCPPGAEFQNAEFLNAENPMDQRRDWGKRG